MGSRPSSTNLAIILARSASRVWTWQSEKNLAAKWQLFSIKSKAIELKNTGLKPTTIDHLAYRLIIFIHKMMQRVWNYWEKHYASFEFMFDILFEHLVMQPPSSEKQ